MEKKNAKKKSASSAKKSVSSKVNTIEEKKEENIVKEEIVEEMSKSSSKVADRKKNNLWIIDLVMSLLLIISFLFVGGTFAIVTFVIALLFIIIGKPLIKHYLLKGDEPIGSESKSLGLFTPLMWTLVFVALATWIISSGTFNGAEFTAGIEPVRMGIADFFENILASMSGTYLTQVIFLAVVGVFYGIISKTCSYNAMVKLFANSLKGRAKVYILVCSFIFAFLSSFITQPLVLVILVPLVYSVAKELKINKVSAMLMTFGSICVGIMGSLFSGYGLSYLTSSFGNTVKDGILYRVIILIIGYFLINFFTILFNKKNANATVVEDMFEDENTKTSKAWPMIITFAVIFLFIILGFISYSGTFELNSFSDFHTWLTTKVVVGEGDKEVAIIGKLLGSNAVPFGNFDLFTMSYLMIAILIFVKIFAKIELNTLLNNALDGLKKMAKPIVLVILANALFVMTYNNNSPLTSNVLNALNQGDGFNPLFNALSGFIGAIFHVDFEYSGFLLGPLYAAKFANNSNQILAIATSMNGFASLFVPSSVIMLSGLSMTKLSYIDWLKAIWKFLLALIVAFIVIFAIISFV